MSRSQIRKKIQNSLLKNFEKEEGEVLADTARRLNESSLIKQCLVVDAESIEQLTVGFEAGINNVLDGRTRTSYKRFLVKRLRDQATAWKPLKAEEAYFERMVEEAGLTLTGSSPTVLYFPGRFRKVKDRIHDIAREFADDLENSDKYSATRAAGTDGYNLDHGKHGTSQGLLGAAIGAGAMRARAKKGKRKSDELSDKEFADTVVSNFVDIMETKLNRVVSQELKNTIKSLVLHWDQYIDKNGNVKAGFAMLLTPVSDKDNKAEAALEADIQNAFIDAFHMTFDGLDYGSLEGSSSLEQKIAKFIVHDSLLNNIRKQAGIKVTTGVKKNISLDTSTSLKDTKIGGSKKVSRISLGGGKAAKRPTGPAKQAKSTQRSFFNVMAMINQKLPATVEKNMGVPRLENQTGRFAQSVKITDVAQTGKGFPSFGYTYQKSPYQVYETGKGRSPWADGHRDPRTLIDASIRELAANLALGRFYTRRV